MNYITEINRFYDWLETNPVSDSSIILWHALMHINNKSGWRQEFTVAISTLELKTALSKSSIIRARNLLQQVGRLSFKSRSGQQSAVYSMVAFQCESQSEPQTDTQSATQSGTQTGTQSATIIKLEENKLKKGKPPDLKEVLDYFDENGYLEDSAHKFFKYYSSSNWHDSNGKKVKSWKQKALAVWFKPENKKVIYPVSKIAGKNEW